MTDTEVMRLRGLRNNALRTRALAYALSNRQTPSDMYVRTAIACWRISRIITGELSAHPYLSYQSGPSGHRAIVDRAFGGVRALLASNPNGGMRAFVGDVERLCRDLDDAIALTWSPTLNETLGRARVHLRRLLVEALASAGMEGMARPTVGALIGASRPASPPVSWPYLAM
jgi:hypothetical protein